jgi:HK97 family phage portal protein
MGRYTREDYLKSTIQPWEGSGEKGMKPRPHNYLSLLKEFNSWVYSACMYNARGVASQSLKLYARKPRYSTKSNFPTRGVDKKKVSYLRGEGEIKPSKGVMRAMGHDADVEEVLEHPVLDVLKTPTPFMSGYDLSILRMLNLQLTGNCYIHPIFNQAGVPAELWNMPSQWVGVCPDRETNMVGGYVYGRQPSLIKFQLDEVLHNKLPNPHDEFYGHGWVESALSASQLLREMDNYEHALFKNHARPDWGLFLNENLSDKQYQRIENQIDKKLGGNRKQGKPFLFEGGIDAKPLQWTPRDLAFDSGESRKIENISAISGVPVSMLKANDPNLASAREGNLGWLRNTIQPYCVSDEEFLNRSLIKLFGDFGEHLFLAYENPVPSDKSAESTLFVQEIQAGIRTRNEVRVELGLEPIEGGDELLIPNGLMPVSQAGAQQEMMQQQMSMQQQMRQQQKPQLRLSSETPKQPELETPDGQERFGDGSKNKALVLEIVDACQKGLIPRDSAIAQCQIVCGLSKKEAHSVVGSAGLGEGYFKSEREAEEYGAHLGLTGSHTMFIDGVTWYMPASTHEEWEQFQRATVVGSKAGYSDSQKRDTSTGRWEDTGGGGQERDSSRGNRIMKEGEITKRTAKELSEKLIYDGGFTYHPNTNTQPTSGFAVSTYPEKEMIVEWNEEVATGQMENLRSQLRAYVKKHRQEFIKNGKAHFGGWYDKESGRIYFDMSTIVGSAKEADMLSRQHKQEAYFNLETFETIKVGARDDSKPRTKEPKVGASTI